jgi:hypothetical protein
VPALYMAPNNGERSDKSLPNDDTCDDRGRSLTARVLIFSMRGAPKQQVDEERLEHRVPREKVPIAKRKLMRIHIVASGASLVTKEHL